MSLGKIISNAAIMLSLKESPNCDPYSKFDLIDMKISPNPAKVGQDVYMAVEFKNNYDEVNKAIQKTKLTFNDFHIPVNDIQLCDVHSGLCPIKLGYNYLNNSFIAPDSIGNYNIKIGWFTEDSLTSLLCFKGDFEIIPASNGNTFRGK
jgi:hypothetical protein